MSVKAGQTGPRLRCGHLFAAAALLGGCGSAAEGEPSDDETIASAAGSTEADATTEPAVDSATTGESSSTTSTTTGLTAPPEDEEGDETGDPVPPIVFDFAFTTGGQAACDVQEPVITFIEPTLVFVLDASGSMSFNDIDTGMGLISRWNALHNTVTLLLEQYAERVEFGMKLFPTDSLCGVSPGLDVDPALDNGDAILAAMPAALSDLSGSTPLTTGLEAAGQVIEASDPRKPRAILLLVDGGVSTSCDGNSVTGTEAELLRLQGEHEIATYVVGVDITSGGAGDMNRYAEAGGVPLGNAGDAVRFYNVTDTAQLQTAMDDIVGDLLACDLNLDSSPDHPSLTEVAVDDMNYDQVTLDECDADADGWTYSIEHTQIRLCGAACSAFKEAQAATVEFFCPAG